METGTLTPNDIDDLLDEIQEDQKKSKSNVDKDTSPNTQSNETKQEDEDANDDDIDSFGITGNDDENAVDVSYSYMIKCVDGFPKDAKNALPSFQIYSEKPGGWKSGFEKDLSIDGYLIYDLSEVKIDSFPNVNAIKITQKKLKYIHQKHMKITTETNGD